MGDTLCLFRGPGDVLIGETLADHCEDIALLCCECAAELGSFPVGLRFTPSRGATRWEKSLLHVGTLP
jgi:hypothetical protein